MIYILYYFGKIPSHVTYCINSILTVDQDAVIYFCTSEAYDNQNVINVNFNDYPALIDKKVQIKSYLKDSPLEENQLWFTSLIRTYAVKTIVEEFNIEEFVHFDTDVLLFKSFSDIENNYEFDKEKINITFLDKNHLVFGYSYFPKKDLIIKLCNLFDQVFKNYEFYKNNYSNGGVFNEMRMMKIVSEIDPNLVSELESLPYNNKNLLFDPAGYGQYLDGSHNKNGNYFFKRRWVSVESYVGREIKSKRIKFKFDNRTPRVLFDQKSIELCNLHIHSKRLSKFLPKNYSLNI